MKKLLHTALPEIIGGLVVAAVLAVAKVLIQTFESNRSPLLIASVVVCIVVTAVVLWFALRTTVEEKSEWRWLGLVVILVTIVLYSGWVGTQIDIPRINNRLSELVIYYDFESDADLEGWQGDSEASTDHAFTGKHALKSLQPVQAGQDTRIALSWEHEVTADVIVGQVYWPEEEEISVEWAQVCVPLSGWACVGIPKNRGGWNTFVLDLSEMEVGDPPKSLDQFVLPGLHFQGRLRGSNDSNVTTMPMYIDAIQIYHDGKE